MNLLRAMQEAVASVVKHSQATKVRVAFSLDNSTDKKLQVPIENDGIGASQEHGSSRGIANMQNRLASLNGTIGVSFTDIGTKVVLSIPTHSVGISGP